MNRKRLLALVLIFTLIPGLFGCGNGDRKTRANEEEMQTLMSDYVREKYGFEPKILSFKRNAFFNTVNDYMVVSDGYEEFTVWANQYSEISDDYEIDDIEADLAEWMESKMFGVYHVRLNTLRMLTLDQKYDGSGFAFLKANNEIFDFTVIYVNRYFTGDSAIGYVKELADSYNWRYDCCFLNCPSEHAAEEMSKHSMVNDGGLEAMYYEPYVLQCLSGTSSRAPQLDEYNVYKTGNTLYSCSVERDSETGIDFSVSPAEKSISQLAPTYHIEYMSPDTPEFIFYIPMSEVDFDFEKYKRENPDREVVHTLFGYISDSEGNFENGTRCYTEMRGEYVRLTVSASSSDFYFTLIST